MENYNHCQPNLSKIINPDELSYENRDLSNQLLAFSLLLFKVIESRVVNSDDVESDDIWNAISKIKIPPQYTEKKEASIFENIRSVYRAMIDDIINCVTEAKNREVEDSIAENQKEIGEKFETIKEALLEKYGSDITPELFRLFLSFKEQFCKKITKNHYSLFLVFILSNKNLLLGYPKDSDELKKTQTQSEFLQDQIRDQFEDLFFQ